MYEPGTIVAGKYRIERLLGRGGMGVVFAAEHLELRIPIALKFLGDRYATRTDIVTRFLREARAAAQLKSAHVCRVSDVGRLDDGVPFIVMEMLVGQDLAKVLRAEGTLSVPTAADYIAQACDAVAEAHAAGIIHRDLKPGNLFLAQHRDGLMIKVLDFGVAKVHSEDDHGITSSQTVVGSPTYMAPEQLRSARGADPRSDIWSLGVILHQLVTGSTPFHGETIADLAIRATMDPLPPLDHLPPAFGSVVARCLEKHPDQRFQTASELASALAPLVTHPSQSSRVITGPVVMSPQTELGPRTGDPGAPIETTLRGAASVMTVAPRSTNQRAIVIGVVAAIAIGVGGGLLLTQPTTTSQPTSAPVVQMPAQATSIAPAIPVSAPSDAMLAPPADAATVATSPVDVPAATTHALVKTTPPQQHVPKPPPPVHHAKTKEEIGASRL